MGSLKIPRTYLQVVNGNHTSKYCSFWKKSRLCIFSTSRVTHGHTDGQAHRWAIAWSRSCWRKRRLKNIKQLIYRYTGMCTFNCLLTYFVRCQQKQAWLAVFGSEMCVTVVNETLFVEELVLQSSYTGSECMSEKHLARPFQWFIVCWYWITLSLLGGDLRFYRQSQWRSPNYNPCKIYTP